ncbi:MAG TPA: NTP transferase domain-containing protein [Vicinamibacteria bacterium]|nr:NTP transferase domain-containing protein [Vicinamibacteria bacterium]
MSVVLAAGGSTRMGRPKMVLPLGDRTVLAAAVQPHLDAGVGRVVVVLGDRSAEVMAKAGITADPRLRAVVNAEWAEGMSSSIRRGLAEAADAEAVLIALGDEPGLAAERIRRLIGAWRPGVPLVVPVQEGRAGHPVLFDRRLFGELAALTGDVGAREVVRRHWGAAATIEAGPLADLDTEADYRAFRDGRLEAARAGLEVPRTEREV